MYKENQTLEGDLKNLLKVFFPKKDISDFEKRKLAEQRATKRLKGEAVKENKEKGIKKENLNSQYLEL